MSLAGLTEPTLATDHDPTGGLTEAEASRRLAASGGPARRTSSRSYASIVRANVLTVFNLILAGFGVVRVGGGCVLRGSIGSGSA